MESSSSNEKTKVSRLPYNLLFVNLFLSSWGDRMWKFSVGLFLVKIYNDELLLTAVFGFTCGLSILIFGGIVGQWVDSNGRLKVVRWSLFIQNICVAIAAVFAYMCLALDDKPKTDNYDMCRTIYVLGLISLSVLAQLASMAYKISVEKDWIVVIASSKVSQLANLNAITRVIDLSCKMFSPIISGIIMSFGSFKMSALFIASWNIVSLFVEYFLLSQIYNLVPELAIKTLPKPEENGTLIIDGDKVKSIKVKQSITIQKNLRHPFLMLYNGWKTYYNQNVLWAGVALSLLYMTVLGFDSITIGYIYANKVTPLFCSLAMTLGGIGGLIGTASFTVFRRRVGLERTGLFAFNFELICLMLCVLSIWAPGSLFDPMSIFGSISSSDLNEANATLLYNATDLSASSYFNGSATLNINMTSNLGAAAIDYLKSTTTTSPTDDDVLSLAHLLDGHNISIVLFLAGIITSRIGLWMADLVVTQIQQESVKQSERGVVNGVQNSLNMFLDLIKFGLVIIIPRVESFGYLIMMSFVFILIASVCFAAYSRSVRGHLFHFYKIFNISPLTMDVADKSDTKTSGESSINQV